MSLRPLLVFDTNIVFDAWLGREDDNASTLLNRVENGHAELVVPEYVLHEFRGAALRWIHGERINVGQQIRRSANEWSRSHLLGRSAGHLREAALDVEAGLESLQHRIDEVAARVAAVGLVVPHTPEIHVRGELRFVSGRPPGGTVRRVEDCRIYEAVLDIAREQQAVRRGKVLVTRDADFDHPELLAELAALDFTVVGDLGRLSRMLLGGR